MPDEPVDDTINEKLSRQFYQHDPLLVLLLDKLRLGVGWGVVGVALLAGAVLVGGFELAGVSVGQQAVVVAVLQPLLVLPIGMAIYLSLPNALAGLLNTLRKNGVVGNSRQSGYESYATFEQELAARADSRWWVVAAAIGVTIYWSYRLLGDVPDDMTKLVKPDAQLWFRLVILIIYTPVLYGAIVSLGRFLAVLLYTRRLFRCFEIRVNPLHPDGSAGMAGIGRMLTISVLLATAVGAIAVADLLTGSHPFSRLETWVLGAVYLVSLPLLFLGWLWLPHRALLAARDEALSPLAAEFLRSIPKATSCVHEDADAIKANTDRMVEIKRQYELLAETFPVWPIPTAVLNRLAVTSLLPFFSSLLAIFVPLIWNSVVGQ
jgi:hypothetical protein